MKKTILASLMVGGILLLRNYTNQMNQTSNPQVLSTQDEVSQSTLTPTPFPFQELTIPYLKNRSYQSTLGDRTQVIDNDRFTGYLTSYDSDGLNIRGLLTIPTTPPPENGFPTVIFIHGYIPPQQYETLKNYQSYVEYLASQGLIVLKIDLRGHGQSEGEASGAYYSGDYIIDTLNAYKALEEFEFVDPNRIGLWGHSMAGNIVLRTIAAKPNIPKAVIWAGAVYSYEDFSQFRIQDSSYQPPSQTSDRQRKRDELFATYGRYDPASAFWQQVPATNYLDGITTNLQIHHAINDNVVDIGYSRNLMQVLDNTSIPHELFEYDSGGHNIAAPAFNKAMSRTAEFLAKE